MPQRTCVSCRRVLSKRELHRIVRTPDGVKYDPTGKMAGRGAYLCASRTCWQTALRQGSLARALKTVLTPEEKAMLSELAAKLGLDNGGTTADALTTPTSS
ncbi:MAG: YlxR family protein [Anaerolineae bacterium]|nr:YlxR family protein [Caldilineales bacterium]MCX7852209.1 YlxR family protein [Caldilineales bacterium]MDW8268051.1 YlxR family protein [Anaerolineae bacterium]